MSEKENPGAGRHRWLKPLAWLFRSLCFVLSLLKLADRLFGGDPDGDAGVESTTGGE
ncbi:hypothetical protein [Nocardiopsis sp. NPDC006938]|uniref:hypothetical protein n=1 Tax=Nocardiopsis sp. NPDC006938 TaxID=3364337 RepID=UPI0036B14291